jgi:flagellin
MRIQHNITALNAANRLKTNESAVSKNIQKLSSGYRINSAADDAAGLAVSEKMRKEINGLSQAEDNTKNGISLVQTAEGGLNETSAILQRMNTLAVESANGTYKDTDRANLQKEVDHLKTEIDRIANSTNFNEIKLLDGSLGTAYKADFTPADDGITKAVVSGGNIASGDSVTLKVTTSKTEGKVTVAFGSAVTGVSFEADSTSFAAGGVYTFTAVIDDDTASAADAAKFKDFTIIVTRGSAVPADDDNAQDVTITATGHAPLTFQVGAENVDDQRATLSINAMDSKGLGIDGNNLLIDTQEHAEAAISTIADAVAIVNRTRADLGALQNELEHTANNLSTMNENLTSAESTIRDVDMTDEYVQYSKNQILAQAANAMLAQANTQPQNVLTLLKG